MQPVGLHNARVRMALAELALQAANTPQNEQRNRKACQHRQRQAPVDKYEPGKRHERNDNAADELRKHMRRRIFRLCKIIHHRMSELARILLQQKAEGQPAEMLGKPGTAVRRRLIRSAEGRPVRLPLGGKHKRQKQRHAAPCQP
ncbi:hypothetical protein D3C81_667740 [compost metagenome]